MRRLTTLVACALACAVATTVTAKPSKPAGGPMVTKSQAPKGGPPKAPSGAQAKPSTGKPVKPAKTDATAAKAESGRPSRAASSSSTSTSTTRTVAFTSTALGEKLQNNSALRSKIESKLAAAGYTGTVYEAAYGFKNLGQFNAATNQVQNHGYSFDLLKVQMTGMYVDPKTHAVYRATRLPDGTVKLVSPELATNPVSTTSLGQSKQAIAAGAEMPKIVPVTTTKQ